MYNFIYKSEILSHQDLAQIQMFINYNECFVKLDTEHKTIRDYFAKNNTKSNFISIKLQVSAINNEGFG